MRHVLFIFAILLPATSFAQEGSLPDDPVGETAAEAPAPADGDPETLPEGEELDAATSAPAAASPSDVHLPDDIGVVPPEETAPVGVGVPVEPPPQGTGEIVAPQGGPTPVSDFVDTRLSFSFSDDDFLASPADHLKPNSPDADFSPRRANKLFFENLNSRDTGQETMTHLVLYRRFPGYLRGIDTEAAFVVRFNLYSNDENGIRGQSFYDDGSYIKVSWFPGGDVLDEDAVNFALTMFPFDTNRFRLGYLYDISWGGPEIFGNRWVSAPGAKLQLTWGPFYLYGGAKTARLQHTDYWEMQAFWGFLGGIGIDILETFTVEAGGGYFNRGTLNATGVEGEPVLGYGGSARAVFHYGTGAGASVDFRLYRNDPATTDLFLQSTDFESKFSAYAALEGTLLQQTLRSGDLDRLSTTVAQTATAAAFSSKLQLWYVDLGADVVYRDLAFVLYNRLGYVPGQDFYEDVEADPEFMFATSVAAHAPAIRSTFAAVFGVQWPATYNAGSEAVVVRNMGSQDILPCKRYDDPSRADRTCVESFERSPIYALRGAVKVDVSQMLSLVAETTLYLDNNQTNWVDDEQGQATQVFHTTGDLGFPLRFGAGLFAQARF